MGHQTLEDVGMKLHWSLIYAEEEVDHYDDRVKKSKPHSGQHALEMKTAYDELKKVVTRTMDLCEEGCGMIQGLIYRALHSDANGDDLQSRAHRIRLEVLSVHLDPRILRYAERGQFSVQKAKGIMVKIKQKEAEAEEAQKE